MVRYVTRDEWKANVRGLPARPFPPIARHIAPACLKVGFIQTTDGRFWTQNDQLGYVEVPSDSPGLLHAATLRLAEVERASGPDRTNETRFLGGLVGCPLTGGAL